MCIQETKSQWHKQISAYLIINVLTKLLESIIKSRLVRFIDDFEHLSNKCYSHRKAKAQWLRIQKYVVDVSFDMHTR